MNNSSEEEHEPLQALEVEEDELFKDFKSPANDPKNKEKELDLSN